MLYRFLQSVWNLYVQCKQAGVARTATNRISKLSGLRHQPDRHPIRIVIDATSTADRKSKSRWTQALRYAWRERSKWGGLEQCLRANGGVAGCAQKFADLQVAMRTPPGCVRVGGEDRVPLIPLFVGVELLDK